MENGGGGGAAPTGCYKCGRPGHWSRDCPSNPNQNPNPNPNPNSFSPNYSNNINKTNSSSTLNLKTNSSSSGFGGPKPLHKSSSEKPKKVPRTRPKLTPDLLLSNDGIGYILRHFPRAFKYHGRGHEFVHKVEQVGATRRVKTCLGGLRERVANGGDPTKLHESPVEPNVSNNDEAVEVMDIEQPCLVQEDTSLKAHDTDSLHEDMLQEIYKKASEEPSSALNDSTAAANTSSHHSSMQDLTSEGNQAPDKYIPSIPGEIHISEEQKARMEANRSKALERAAARARAL